MANFGQSELSGKNPLSVTEPNSSESAEINTLLEETFFRGGLFIGPRDDQPLKKNKYGFEYAEHSFLGDTIYLKDSAGHDIVAAEWKFALPNGLELSYGQINGLAGDLYGTHQPISDGVTAADQTSRFYSALDTLVTERTRTPTEAAKILKILQQEVDAVNKAIGDHKDPWDVAYPSLDKMNILLQNATLGRPAPGLSYLALAQINWDHFGKDARTVYNVGHGAALDVAIKGKDSNEQLERAYAMNAFADHFLEDCFAAGHLRTPRRVLHKQNDPTADICAKLMHDEDNAISLNVENLQNQKFKAYGDKRLLSPDNATNLAACKSAVTASTAEIYEAWHTGNAPEHFKAWQFAPMLESALDAAAQELKPLFIEKNGVQRRSDIHDRRDSSLTTHFWYWSTALDCKSSGRWKYPQPKMDS